MCQLAKSLIVKNGTLYTSFWLFLYFQKLDMQLSFLFGAIFMIKRCHSRLPGIRCYFYEKRCYYRLPGIRCYSMQNILFQAVRQNMLFQGIWQNMLLQATIQNMLLKATMQKIVLWSKSCFCTVIISNYKVIPVFYRLYLQAAWYWLRHCSLTLLCFIIKPLLYVSALNNNTCLSISCSIINHSESLSISMFRYLTTLSVYLSLFQYKPTVVSLNVSVLNNYICLSIYLYVSVLCSLYTYVCVLLC